MKQSETIYSEICGTTCDSTTVQLILHNIMLQQSEN